MAAVDMPNPDDALARLAQARQAAIARDDRRSLADIAVARGSFAIRRGDVEAGRAHMEEGLAYFRALGDRPGEARALVVLSAELYTTGDLVAARDYAEQSLKINQALDHPQRIARSLHYLGLIAAAEGDRTAARAELEESLALFRAVGYIYAVADVLHALGWLRLEAGEPEAARALFAESLSLARANRDTALLPLVLDGIAALIVREDPTRAARFREAGAILRSPPGWLPSSVEWRRRTPDAGEIAWTTQGRAAAPLAGDRSLSLDAILAEAEAAVAPTAPQNGRDGLVAAESPRPAHPMGLSGREVEVLRLIAEGRTNREIAAALFLSEHTVRHHIAHILAKTGSANRAEATAFALRHALA